LPHDTEANPATSLIQRVKEGAARLSPSMNRLVPPVQQFRRTLKGATALRTIGPRTAHVLRRILPPSLPLFRASSGTGAEGPCPPGRKAASRFERRAKK